MNDNDFDKAIAKLQRMIDESRSIVFFGGAGVSTESGIPDFRSTDGLYHQQWNYPPEQMLSRSFFDAKPAEFYRFYREKLIVKDVKPNAAHKKLAELEKAGKLTAVVTQNIDGLHQAAGSKNVFELHGSTLRNYCMKCGAPYDIDFIAEKFFRFARDPVRLIRQKRLRHKARVFNFPQKRSVTFAHFVYERALPAFRPGRKITFARLHVKHRSGDISAACDNDVGTEIAV